MSSGAASPAPIRTRSATTERDGRTRDRSRPPLPEPLPVPVVDNHTHLDIGDSAGEPEGSPGAEEPAGSAGSAGPAGPEGSAGSAGPGRSAGAPVDIEYGPGAVPGTTIAELLAAGRAVGVPRTVQIGCDLAAARWTRALLDTQPAAPDGSLPLLGGVAIHPNEAPLLDGREGRPGLDDALAEIERLLRHPRMRVVGETGLDYFRTPSAGRTAQEESFRRHIDLAKRTGLALQIHDRDAHDDVVRVLLAEGAPERTVLHCFSGGVDLARTAAEHGWYCSFAGVVTFRSARALRGALAVLPAELLLVETDAPFLTPEPYRGRPNAAYLLPYTVRAMASVRGEDLGELCTVLAANSETVYGPW